MSFDGECLSFDECFRRQVEFQNELIKNGKYDFHCDELPCDCVKGFSYHIQQLMSEIGEVLESDKRWKAYRSDKFDEMHKLEEIADCFIVLMNIAIFSGFDSIDILREIENKLDENAKRVHSLK